MTSMKILRQLACAVLVCASCLSSEPVLARSGKGYEKRPIQLTLPPAVYAVPGIEIGIYYDNIVLDKKSKELRFKFECRIGRQEERRWILIADERHVGAYKLSVTVSNGKSVLAQARTTVIVSPAYAGAKRDIRLLVIGDSLTAASRYPAEIARLLSRAENPIFTMLGANQVKRNTKVRHEGYGGWTWRTFATKYEKDQTKKGKHGSSPFVFLTEKQAPVLNIRRYVSEQCDDKPPDIATFLLGINDCFGVSRSFQDEKAVNARIDRMFTHADEIIMNFRQACPQATLAVCVTTPPNARESAFEHDYKGKYHRWNWKCVQHRLVQRILEHFGNREKENICLVPTELYIDPVDGYGSSGVHPNAEGYRQIGTSIYCWLKWRLDQSGVVRGRK